MIIGISLVIMLALIGFFYLHIKEDYRHLVMLIKDEAYQLSDIIKKSIKHDMVLNKEGDLQQRVYDITNHDGIINSHDGIITNHDRIVKMRIIDEGGRVKIASDKKEIGQLIDKKAEACNECHRENGQPKRNAHNAAISPQWVMGHVSSPMRNYRIFKNAYGQEVIGIMNPVYNESSCYPCHGSKKKVLGVLDITISLDRVNVFLMASRNRMVLFLIFTFILISITVSLLIRHFVIIPIHKLTKETAMITFGNLDHRICIDSRDEIGDLAEAFNLMTAKLKASGQKIEDRIRVATSQLAAANKDLETANQKQEECNRKKTEMMMAVAHDIRAPLVAIESCLRVVLDGYLRNDPIKEREMLQRAEARIEDQIALVKNLLDFSQITENRWREMKEVNLSEVIRKVMDLMSQLARIKKISLEVQEEAEAVSIRGDEELLARALTNLVDNSMKYSPPKSKILISSQCINDHIQLAVRDNGPGIPENELPLIFDFLFRGTHAKRQKKHGSGLGLSIVKQIVEFHKGEIRVESTDEGSSFFITLPRV